jgi:hypothetical protein
VKRPSFQFYPADWTGNGNLKRCSHKLKGVWVDVLCLLHDSETEYGLLRWPLKEIAQAANCKASDLQDLVAKDVLKGADGGETCRPYVYVPRSGRKDGDPVTLIPEQPGPLWYSSRMVRDEYVRTIRGESSRFEEGGKQPPKPAPKKTPKAAPKPPLGDGSTSSSSSSASPRNTSPPSGAPANTDKPDGPVLTGAEQRSPAPLKTCPKTFIVTEGMVQWANEQFPILSLEDLKKETRAFKNHRFRTGRIEWVPTWENWVKEAADRKTRSARPAGAGTAYRNERDARVAKGAPGLAAPAVRKPGEPLTFVEDVTNDEPRQPRITQG